VVLEGDVTRRDEVHSAFAALEDRWARLDRVVLNAGVGGHGAAATFVECCTSPDQIATGLDSRVVERVMQTNYIGVANFLDPTLDWMRRCGGGRVAITGSMAADGLLVRSGPYTASKVALRALVEGLRVDACSFNVSFTMLEPGFVTTEMTEGVDYEMPFLIEADRAAAAFVRGIEAGRARVRVPWQMSVLNRVAAVFPPLVRVRVAEWAMRRPRQGRP
jgi:NAD(P)-dependent dehydrogenase (short-subunit alcohol dehydrogenase family)